MPETRTGFKGPRVEQWVQRQKKSIVSKTTAGSCWRQSMTSSTTCAAAQTNWKEPVEIILRSKRE